MKTHTERDGQESDSEMRSENNEQTSCDTSENNGAQSDQDNMKRYGVNGGGENKGIVVTRDEHKENNGAEAEEHYTERNGWESDGETRSENNEQTSRDTSENKGAQSEEDNTERDGVNGGAKNKGSTVTGDEHKENNGAETEEY